MAEMTPIDAAGSVLTVIEAVVRQPGPVVHVAEYVCVVWDGVTLILAPFWPVDHVTLPTQPIADRLTGVPTVTFVELAARLSTG